MSLSGDLGKEAEEDLAAIICPVLPRVRPDNEGGGVAEDAVLPLPPLKYDLIPAWTGILEIGCVNFYYKVARCVGHTARIKTKFVKLVHVRKKVVRRWFLHLFKAVHYLVLEKFLSKSSCFKER